MVLITLCMYIQATLLTIFNVSRYIEVFRSTASEIKPIKSNRPTPYDRPGSTRHHGGYGGYEEYGRNERSFTGGRRGGRGGGYNQYDNYKEERESWDTCSSHNLYVCIYNVDSCLGEYVLDGAP